MRLPAAVYAAKRFEMLRLEYSEVIERLGLQALTALVRQKGDPEDRGWQCYEISVNEDLGALTGKFVEFRGNKEKNVLIVMDIASIDSIEFEIYDNHPGDKAAL